MISYRTYGLLPVYTHTYNLISQVKKKPPREALHSLYEDRFVRWCEQANRSMIDMLLYAECNHPSKTSPIDVDIGELHTTLRTAVNLIGAYSIDNVAWRGEAKKRNIPIDEQVVKGVPYDRSKPLSAPRDLNPSAVLYNPLRDAEARARRQLAQQAHKRR